MTTTSLRLYIAGCGLLAAGICLAQELPPEAPIETWNITITQARPGGSLLVRACKQCPMLHLQFDSRSRAIANGKPVSLKDIPEHPSKSALTVIYDPKTKVVHRVIW